MKLILYRIDLFTEFKPNYNLYGKISEYGLKNFLLKRKETCIKKIYYCKNNAYYFKESLLKPNIERTINETTKRLNIYTTYYVWYSTYIQICLMFKKI